jgi:ribosomal protein S28E/S33
MRYEAGAGLCDGQVMPGAIDKIMDAGVAGGFDQVECRVKVGGDSGRCVGI